MGRRQLLRLPPHVSGESGRGAAVPVPGLPEGDPMGISSRDKPFRLGILRGRTNLGRESVGPRRVFRRSSGGPLGCPFALTGPWPRPLPPSPKNPGPLRSPVVDLGGRGRHRCVDRWPSESPSTPLVSPPSSSVPLRSRDRIWTLSVLTIRLVYVYVEENRGEVFSSLVRINLLPVRTSRPPGGRRRTEEEGKVGG